jgi:starch synthase
MPVEEEVEAHIQGIFAKIREQNAPHYSVSVSEHEGKVVISTRYDMLLDPYKSEVENKTVGFPRQALEGLVREALSSGSSQVTVRGSLSRLHDEADDWCGSYDVKDKYDGAAGVTLTLSITDGRPEFSYKAGRAEVAEAPATSPVEEVVAKPRKERGIKVLYVAAECKPFSKGGGVGDVAGELPVALKAEGFDIAVVTPLYSSVDVRKHGLRKIRSYAVRFEGNEEEVSLWEGRLGDVPVLFVESQSYLREGPYVHSDGFPFKEDGKRFSFFAKALLPLVTDDVQIVHGNDWMAGYLFGMMEQQRMPQKRVLTVHNMSYQGNMWIPHIKGWEIEGLLNDGRIGSLFRDPDAKRDSVNPMMLALELSHMVNAVSPTYANEIQQPGCEDRYFEGGKGLEGICRRLHEEGRLLGILNGFNYQHDPTPDRFQDALQKKEDLKKGLAGYFKRPGNILLGFVGRAVEQKFRLLTECLEGKPVLEHILDMGDVNVAIVATGPSEYETFMGNLAIQRRGDGRIPDYTNLLQQPRRENYAPFVAFDTEMARRVNAASDIFLMPSVYEPCGIAQMEALSNATPPLVRWTGGLVDTVRSHTERDGTGFGFDGSTKQEVLRNLIATVREAVAARQDEARFRGLQNNGFLERFRWSDSARKYVALYEAALGA